MSLTRRTLLVGLASSLPVAAEARLAAAIRPKKRPQGLRPPGAPPTAADVLAETGLAAVSGFSLRDLATGRVVEEHRPKAALPPASVTKALTTLYALNALGPDYRFHTGIAVTGPIADGRVQGDLYLVGGGDPHLDTDGLADLAEQVAKAGIFGVNGRCYVVGSSLPYQHEIDPSQPEYVGYNPAISGINLNFNRVHFEWKPSGGQYSIRMSARTRRFDPVVTMADMAISDSGGPVFSYRSAEGRDLWTVNRRALGKGGARWLPVRTPDTYAGDVFRTVAAQYNLRLPDLVPAPRVPPEARIIASVASAPLQRIAVAMLKYSTNLTAEVTGLRASQAMGHPVDSIGASSAAMTEWLRGNFGLGPARFVNHSGLSDETRISADEMVQVLDIAATGPLPGMLKDIPLTDAKGERAEVGGCRVMAKTGTLNFARGLGGYLYGGNGRKFAFTILSADMDARAHVADGVEQPRGSRTWIGKARRQERALLRRWASLYGS